MFKIKYKYQEQVGEELASGGGATGTGAGTVASGQTGQQTTTQSGTQTSQETAGATVSNTEPSWPTNWRELMAGGNDKELARLQRFTSPTAVWPSFRALEQRMSSGELKPNVPFPDKGTPEQQAQWRSDHGVPEAPDKYDLKLPEGTVIGEYDKPAIDSFLKMAHQNNVPADVAALAVNWYFQQNEAVAEERQVLDVQFQKESEDALRTEWGPEYRPNLNMIHGLLDTAPTGLKEKLLGGRLADGSPISSDPDVLRFLAQAAREINPVTTLVPGAGANIQGAVEDEISKIENVMRTDRKKYNSDEKMQQRYRDLLTAREKGRGAA